jgi:hypothetical protein
MYYVYRNQKKQLEMRRISPALSSLRNDPVMAFIFKEYDREVNDRLGIDIFIYVYMYPYVYMCI